MMTHSEATAEVFWTAFQALSRETREQVLARMMSDTTVRDELEDLLDLALAENRSREPVRLLDDVLAELAK